MMIWSPSKETPITVTVPERTALLDDIAERLRKGIGFSVATLNLDHVVKLAADAEFRTAYSRHTHITADGNPIVWLCRLAGQRDVQLVPGSELIDPIVEHAARTGAKIGLFGATDASLTAAATALQARYSGLDIPLILAPPMGFDPEGEAADAAIEQIGARGAQIVFLALGAPKQERFAARAQDRLPGVGFLSIGAGLDFISGAQTRAPGLVRALALEWIWRLLGNPSRLARRYGACIAILPGLTLRALGQRGKSLS